MGLSAAQTGGRHCRAPGKAGTGTAGNAGAHSGPLRRRGSGRNGRSSGAVGGGAGAAARGFCLAGGVYRLCTGLCLSVGGRSGIQRAASRQPAHAHSGGLRRAGRYLQCRVPACHARGVAAHWYHRRADVGSGAYTAGAAAAGAARAVRGCGDRGRRGAAARGRAAAEYAGEWRLHDGRCRRWLPLRGLDACPFRGDGG